MNGKLLVLIQNPNGANNDLDKAKIAHVIVDFYSIGHFGISVSDLDLEKPNENYLEFHKILEELKKDYGKPNVSEIKGSNTRVEDGTNVKWKLKAGEVELTNSGRWSKIIFTDKANSNLKTKTYIPK